MRYLILIFAMLACGCNATINRLTWDAEITRPEPFRTTIMNGETVMLSAQLLRNGEPIALDPATDVQFLWQTNGMAEAWWKVDASATTNGVLSAVWTPSMQPAATGLILFFLGAQDSNGISYRAMGQIRLVHAPGSTPNQLELPSRTIDFATVTVTNAPWLTSEADPIFSAYAQMLNPWIEGVEETLSGLADLPAADSLLSADNSTPNRLSADWMLLGGSSIYQPDFAFSTSNLVFQQIDRWEHGTRLDRDGLYLRRDRRQTDITSSGLYTLLPGEGAATYGPTSILSQGPYPRLVETKISFPSTGRPDEVFALRSDLVSPITNAYLSVSNKTLSVVSLTTDPPSQIWSSEETTAIDPATNSLWIAVRALDTKVDHVADEADPAWGKRLPDGTKNPDPNALFLNTPATFFAGGCSWSANGNYAVLTTDGATAVATGTNATFRIGPNSASWFGFSEGGTVVVGAKPNSMRVGPDTVEIVYPYEHGDFPTLWYTASLLTDFALVDSPLWVDNQNGTATVTAPKTGPSGFWKATSLQTIDSKFETTMPAQFSGGVIGDPAALPVKFDSTIEIEVGGHRYKIPAQLIQ